MKNYIFAIIFILIGGGNGLYGMAQDLPFHCEKDSAEVRSIIETLSAEPNLKFNQKIAKAARLLVDKPVDDGLYTDSLYSLSINVDSFTPMSFVNSCLALAKASETPGAAWRTYSEQLRNYACRKGESDGFPSLFYHTSDWIGDNIYRGNFTEMTDRVDGTRDKTWSLDYLSVNREQIPVLSNPDTYDRVKMTEMGFRTHKIPYLPKQAISSKEVTDELREGDILVLISDKERSDFFTFGIVAIDTDGAHLIHLDSKEGKIVSESLPMKKYFNLMTKYFSGFRWIRAS